MKLRKPKASDIREHLQVCVKWRDYQRFSRFLSWIEDEQFDLVEILAEVNWRVKRPWISACDVSELEQANDYAGLLGMERAL